MIRPLVSCDPGVNHVGLAVWAPLHGDRTWGLARAVLVEVSEPRDAADAAIDLVGGPFDAAVEVPQVYVAGRAKGSGNDLVRLALFAGAVLGAGAKGSRWYLPAQWKGQLPKEVSVARTRGALLRGELDHVELPSGRRGVRAALAHNVWDAVGIGLYALRELGRR